MRQHDVSLYLQHWTTRQHTINKIVSRALGLYTAAQLPQQMPPTSSSSPTVSGTLPLFFETLVWEEVLTVILYTARALDLVLMPYCGLRVGPMAMAGPMTRSDRLSSLQTSVAWQ